MEKGCFRVSPLGTDVTGIVVRPLGAVTRCVSVADTSLSLSLSLSAPNLSGLEPSSGAFRGAYLDLLDGPGRACERGFCHVRRGSTATHTEPLAGAEVDISLGCSPHNPWRTSEEVPSRAPTRAGFVAPKRRGLFHAWPRRPFFRTTMGGASLRPYRSRETLACGSHPRFGQHACEARHASCVLDLLAPRRPEDSRVVGGGC
jgi:hypothetical protein